MVNSPKVNVLFMASEADPLIKVGGLGDVAGSLPRALRSVGLSSSLTSIGLDVRLVIPFHPAIRRDLYSIEQVAEYTVYGDKRYIPVRAFALDLDSLPIYLVGGAPIEQETGVYSANLEADSYKYVFFSIAALELARRLDWRPDILHANDWHTSAAIYSLALNRPTDHFYGQTASLLTIHNLPYLGAMTGPALEAFDLPPAETTSLPAWAGHMALPLGLLTADAVVAVSPGYAKEIITEEFGSGLQFFLRAHAQKITGILNGLDTHKWDPASDVELTSNFSTINQSARAANKSFLQAQLELDVNTSLPVLAMITRMDPQKGVDIAVDALRSLLQSPSDDSAPFQAIFLGTGNPILEEMVRRLETDYPGRIRACITYNEKLSRHIYAGADLLLMPSRYEPCGLSQMIAMHYGCIPIAHATGGLSDTIHDATDPGMSTGFLFKPVTPATLAEAIQRALSVYLHDPAAWQAMQVRGMDQDFSWDRSAMEYLKLYKFLLDHRMDQGKYV